jgi:hypothetical protein
MPPEEILAFQAVVVSPVFLRANVAAGTKRLACAGEHDELDSRIAFAAIQQGSPALNHVLGEGVVLFGAVERDGGDTVLVYVEQNQCVCCHARFSLIQTRSCAGRGSGAQACACSVV